MPRHHHGLPPPPMDEGESEVGGDQRSMVGAARVRDAEEDIFDVAHNNLLRTATEQVPSTGRRQMLASADWAGASVQPAPSKPTIVPDRFDFRAEPSGSKDAPPTKFAMTVGGNVDDEIIQNAHMQAAVQATWAKANALQDQAVSAATRAAVAEARRDAEREKKDALQALDQELRNETEKTVRRLWELAAKEREQAVEKAIINQDAELKRVKQELAAQREGAAEELEAAYKTMKAEVGRVLEDQHAANVNLAVQAAWDRAGRLQETAVANARKEAREEAQAEFEERLGMERLQLGSEQRRALESSADAHVEEIKSDKQEIKSLREQLNLMREELEQARASARDAESNAAKQTKQAVQDAMKAMEQVQKASVDRAVARALASAQAAKGSPSTS